MSGLLCKPRRLLSMVAFGFGGAALIAATARGARHGFRGRINVANHGGQGEHLGREVRAGGRCCPRHPLQRPLQHFRRWGRPARPLDPERRDLKQSTARTSRLLTFIDRPTSNSATPLRRRDGLTTFAKSSATTPIISPTISLIALNGLGKKSITPSSWEAMGEAP